MTESNMQEVIARFESMREFLIDVEVPEGKTLSGIIPYEPLGDQNKGRFKIYATSYDEAKQLVNDYLK